MVISANVWTVAEAAKWSGIPYRTLLNLLNDGQVPCLRVGNPHVQKMGHGKKRRRACNKYMIPRLSFQRWFESLTPPGHQDPPPRRRRPAA